MRTHKARWSRCGLWLALLAVMCGSAAGPQIAFAGGKQTPNERRHVVLHPYLAQKAADSSPDEMVDVIISKMPGVTDEGIEKAMGGEMRRSFSLISAMHARLPARMLRVLETYQGVNVVTPDATVYSTADYNTEQIATTYQSGLNTSAFWQNGFLGADVGVAVLDSGVHPHPDLKNNRVDVVIQSVGSANDGYGHGTHVAGIVAGNSADGYHVGMAPKARIYNIKITDNDGNAKESDLIAGLQWVYNNQTTYNIRVVNISMQSTLAASYMNSPLDAAVEALWLKGVVVVVSAGNRGPVPDAMHYPPSNDPFAITVGAMDDAQTRAWSDDLLTTFSSQGVTQDSFKKPEVLAPGRRILSTLAPGSVLGKLLPDKVIDGKYMVLSGSSMAAPVIAGAVALMLSKQPTLTPDQVKGVLLAYTRGPLPQQGPGDPLVPDLLQVYKTLDSGIPLPLANQGLTPSNLIHTSSGTAAFTNVYFSNVALPSNYYGD